MASSGNKQKNEQTKQQINKSKEVAGEKQSKPLDP